MTRRLGGALIATGIGHAVVGCVLFRGPLAAMVGDGVLNSVRNGQFDREAAFWFMLFGPVCVLMGQLVTHAGAQRDRWLMAAVGWNLIVIGALGALIMPVSGFWILLVLAPLVLRSAQAMDAVGFSAHSGDGGHAAAEVRP